MTTASEKTVFTIPEFCDRNRICRATYYNLKNAGKAPIEMFVGSLRRITSESEQLWRRQREADGAREAAGLHEANAA